MSVIDDIVARLKSECGDTFRLIGLAGDLAAIKDGKPTATPSVYVYVIEEAAADNTRANSVYQRVELDIGVMLVASNLSDPRGGAALSDIEALRKKVKRALVGWQPDAIADAGEAIELVGGKLVKANAGVVWFEQVFGAAVYEGDEA